MKRIFLISIFIVGFACIGCNCNQNNQFELALITDKGDIDDESFNQGAWEGLVAFAEEHNLTHRYYRPTEATDDAYLEAIQLAVAGGAKIVVTPGFLFEPAINRAQTQFPETKFVILDGNPASVTDGTLEDNVYSIFYAEEQAGFLAGYAVVKDGFRKLGFMGGAAVPPVIRFGHGFIFGANAAAVELNLSDGAIDIRYHYTDVFNESPEIKSRAAGWYSAGTEVIFGCGGSIGKSIMAAAEEGNKKVIGVDVDQSKNSPTVITSAMKSLGTSVQLALQRYLDDQWEQIGGTSVVLDASNGGVALPSDFSRFSSFKKADYDTIFAQLAAGDIAININLDQEPNEYTALKKVSVALED